MQPSPERDTNREISFESIYTEREGDKTRRFCCKGHSKQSVCVCVKSMCAHTVVVCTHRTVPFIILRKFASAAFHSSAAVAAAIPTWAMDIHRTMRTPPPPRVKSNLRTTDDSAAVRFCTAVSAQQFTRQQYFRCQFELCMLPVQRLIASS